MHPAECCGEGVVFIGSATRQLRLKDPVGEEITEFETVRRIGVADPLSRVKRLEV